MQPKQTSQNTISKNEITNKTRKKRANSQRDTDIARSRNIRLQDILQFELHDENPSFQVDLLKKKKKKCTGDRT